MAGVDSRSFGKPGRGVEPFSATGGWNYSKLCWNQPRKLGNVKSESVKHTGSSLFTFTLCCLEKGRSKWGQGDKNGVGLIVPRDGFRTEVAFVEDVATAKNGRITVK